MLRERSRVEAIERLDAFYSEEMGCAAELFYQPGLHLISSLQRTRSAWGGYTKPLDALARESSLGVSFSPDLASRVRAEFGTAANGASSAWAQFERLRRICQRCVPYAFTLTGYSMYCDAGTFRPFGDQASLLARTDPRGRELRSRFDGDIFIVDGQRGEIASWAAIKLKSDHVWELAVVTEAPYRGRGLARQVVSAATAHILDQGRVPLYIYDRANTASGKVCRALGYQEYALQFFCEY